MLTDEGDLVLDPFAGSCVTGEVSESLERNWICIDLDEMYLKGTLARFVGVKPQLPKVDSTPYQIYPPCALNGAAGNSPLPEDGGVKRPIKRPQQKRLDLK